MKPVKKGIWNFGSIQAHGHVPETGKRILAMLLARSLAALMERISVRRHRYFVDLIASLESQILPSKNLTSRRIPCNLNGD
jgi:hypothetical protein